MKRVMSTTVVLALALSAAPALAQAPAQGQTFTIGAGIERMYQGAKTNVLGAAEKMPESDYAFKPTPEIRAYGQLFGHILNSHFGGCARLRGVPNPHQGVDFEKTAASKADVIKNLNELFALCDPLFTNVDDASVTELAQVGNNKVARGLMLTGTLTHLNEMYGIATVYLRLKGLVPPSTEREMERRRGGL